MGISVKNIVVRAWLGGGGGNIGVRFGWQVKKKLGNTGFRV